MSMMAPISTGRPAHAYPADDRAGSRRTSSSPPVRLPSTRFDEGRQALAIATRWLRSKVEVENIATDRDERS